MRIRLSRNASFRRGGWVLQVMRGKGAGYVGGWTAYASGGDVRRSQYVAKGTRRFGVTKNANRVPVTKH